MGYETRTIRRCDRCGREDEIRGTAPVGSAVEVWLGGVAVVRLEALCDGCERVVGEQVRTRILLAGSTNAAGQPMEIGEALREAGADEPQIRDAESDDDGDDAQPDEAGQAVEIEPPAKPRHTDSGGRPLSIGDAVLTVNGQVDGRPGQITSIRYSGETPIEVTWQDGTRSWYRGDQLVRGDADCDDGGEET